jgi:hypothetical protein
MASAVRPGGRRVGLEIVLLKQTVVLPWSQFLYAEGGDDRIRLVFSTHDVEITGNKLGSLLTQFCGQRISRLSEPDQAAKFTPDAGPRIMGISVRKAD